MRALRMVLPTIGSVTLAPAAWLAAGALLLAGMLLSVYVDLLHESIERGVQLRATQNATASVLPLAGDGVLLARR